MSAGTLDLRPGPLDEDVLRGSDVLDTLERQRLQLHRALQEAQQARVETEILFRLAQATGACETPEEVFAPALDAVQRLAGAERSSILLFDEGGVMRFRAWRGLSAEYRAAVDGHSPWTPDAVDPQPILVSDVAEDPSLAGYRAVLASEDIRSLAFVPLVARRRLLGKFMLYWRQPRLFSDHERELARTIAAHVAEAIERARVQHEERRSRERVTRLQRVTASLNEALTREAIGEACLPLVREAVGGSIASLYLLSDGGTHLELVHMVGFPVPAGYRRIPVEASVLPADAVRERRPKVIETPEAYGAAYPDLVSDFVDAAGARVALPLVIERRAFGALGIGFPTWRVLSREDLEFLGAVASQCAQALERARLHEAERRARASAEAAERRRAAIERVSEAALGHLETGSLLDEMLSRVRSVFGCDLVAVFLLDEERGALRIRACDGLPRQSWERAAFPCGTGVASAIAEQRRPRIVEDVTAVDVAWPVLRERMRSLAGVPLLLRDEVLGVLQVGSAERRRFTPDDIALLEMVAVRIASALDRAAAYESLRRAEERLHVALDAGRMGVWEWIADRGRVRWSPTLEAIHGLAPGSFGGTFEEARADIHPEDRERVLRAVRENLETGGSHHLDYRIVRTDGEVRWLAAQGQVLTDGEGRPTGMTGICRDVTEQKLQEEARERAIAELTRNARFHEIFTGILGHDLRNPLGAILMGAHYALAQNEDQRLVKPLARILRSAERMARMIDQLLDFTRVRLGGGIPVDPRRVDLLPVLRQVVDELDDAHPDAVLHFAHDGDSHGSWDPDRLAQVFSNLVGNALRHGNGPEVRVRLDGAAPEAVRFEVQNAGRIPEELLPKLFEPLAGRAVKAGSTQGFGLGLFISHEIVRAHGGRLEVRSEEETGTTFRVTLPRTPTGGGEAA